MLRMELAFEYANRIIKVSHDLEMKEINVKYKSWLMGIIPKLPSYYPETMKANYSAIN